MLVVGGTLGYSGAARLAGEAAARSGAGLVSLATRPGVAVLPKGLWSHNTLNGATSNALVPDSLTDLAGGACFNDARVEVERA